MGDEEQAICWQCGKPCDGLTVTTYNDKGEVLRVRCGGCDLAERVEKYTSTHIIETKLLLSAICKTTEHGWAADVRASYERILARVKDFETMWWRGPTQKAVDASSQRGWRVDHESLTMLVWSCAGRTMVTLGRPAGDHITLIVATSEADRKLSRTERRQEARQWGSPGRRRAEPTEAWLTCSTMGIHEIRATEQSARAMLDQALLAHARGELTLVSDDKVGVL